jgi:hypothetical protein
MVRESRDRAQGKRAYRSTTVCGFHRRFGLAESSRELEKRRRQVTDLARTFLTPSRFGALRADYARWNLKLPYAGVHLADARGKEMHWISSYLNGIGISRPLWHPLSADALHGQRRAVGQVTDGRRYQPMRFMVRCERLVVWGRIWEAQSPRSEASFQAALSGMSAASSS